MARLSSSRNSLLKPGFCCSYHCRTASMSASAVRRMTTCQLTNASALANAPRPLATAHPRQDPSGNPPFPGPGVFSLLQWGLGRSPGRVPPTPKVAPKFHPVRPGRVGAIVRESQLCSSREVRSSRTFPQASWRAPPHHSPPRQPVAVCVWRRAEETVAQASAPASSGGVSPPIVRIGQGGPFNSQPRRPRYAKHIPIAASAPS